jgi:menaquinone-specific isochorismate synthase
MTSDQIADWENEERNQRPMLQSPPEGRLVSYSLPAPDISAAVFLQLAEGKERFFWQNGRDQTLFAGFGIAVQLMAWGASRFQEIKHKTETLFREAVRLADQPEVAAPRLIGGFAFRNDFTPDNTWAVFHPAHFILPHYQLVKSGERSWLTINALLPEDDDLVDIRAQLHEALLARLSALHQAGDTVLERPSIQSTVHSSYPMTYQSWNNSIDEAISRINNTKLEKVVLSRVCELRSKERIDVCRALSYLNQQYRECTRFLFEPRPYHAFYGATPELLIQTSGSQLRTMALAGSMQRSANPSEDAAMVHQLFNSEKDRHEHALVLNSIRRRLEPFGVQLEIPGQPEIYTLSYIHHLLTPIKGHLRHSIGVLPLVEALHPTPALGGSPRDLALEFIRHAESVPRGWYAGPIGWIDANMDGEFGVGIRSAVAQDRRVWLYAGAGIVADSDPQKEWLETALKFQPMFSALGLRKEQPDVDLEEQL